MEYPILDEDQLKFPIPSGVVVSGPSCSGKTELVLRLLNHAEEVFTPSPAAIAWCYGEFGDHIAQMQGRPGWVLHEGSPSDAFLKGLPRPFVLVLDDLMGEIEPKRLADLFTKKAHHQNFSVWMLAQNLFDRVMRVPRTNAQFLILLRAPNDMLSVRNLAQQLFPRQSPFFINAYQQACAEPYGYLLVNMHASSPDILRLRTNILPGDEHIVFAPVSR